MIFESISSTAVIYISLVVLIIKICPIILLIKNVWNRFIIYETHRCINVIITTNITVIVIGDDKINSVWSWIVKAKILILLLLLLMVILLIYLFNLMGIVAWLLAYHVRIIWKRVISLMINEFALLNLIFLIDLIQINQNLLLWLLLLPQRTLLLYRFLPLKLQSFMLLIIYFPLSIVTFKNIWIAIFSISGSGGGWIRVVSLVSSEWRLIVWFWLKRCWQH